MLEFLQRSDVGDRLVGAVAAGEAPLAAISSMLEEAFGDLVKEAAVRRRLGFYLTATLEKLGFEVAKANVPLRHPIFGSAALYRPKAPAEPASLSERLAPAFSQAEAEALIKALLERFPALRTRLTRSYRERRVRQHLPGGHS